MCVTVASPNTVRTTVTATDSSFTVDIDNDLDIESVETEDADNDTRAPREQTSVHVDEIKSQETETVKFGTSKRKMIDDTDTQTSVQALSEHTVTDMSSSDSVSEKSAANIMSVPPDKPTVTIVNDSDKRVDVQCSYLTWISRHYMSRHTEHRQAATQGDGATTQRSDVSMASTIAMRATTEESSRTQTTFGPYTGNMVITPSMYVAPQGVLICPGSEFDSETHARMPLTYQLRW